MNICYPRFTIGQIIEHKMFHYRGVIIDVDPVFQGTDEWYEKIAGSRPPKTSPWYHVLVDNEEHQTYVAERNLLKADNQLPIKHPMLNIVFDRYDNGLYSSSHSAH